MFGKPVFLDPTNLKLEDEILPLNHLEHNTSSFLKEKSQKKDVSKLGHENAMVLSIFLFSAE